MGDTDLLSIEQHSKGHAWHKTRRLESRIALMAWFWRQQWTVENRVHYVRDDTMGEDRGQSHTGNAAEALATFRNAIIGLIRYHGRTNVAAAIRHHDAFPQKALQLIGAIRNLKKPWRSRRKVWNSAQECGTMNIRM